MEITEPLIKSYVQQWPWNTTIIMVIADMFSVEENE